MAKNEATASVIMAKKIAFTRSENRPIRNDSSERQRERGGGAEGDRAPADLEARQRDRDAVAADAEEHGVRERHDAGVAEQQVVARHQQHEDADLGRDVERRACRER